MSRKSRFSITGAILSLVFLVVSPDALARTMRLENGKELRITRIQPSRILPQAFHDQALSSIPGVYPDSRIIAKRRIGYLRKNPTVLYSVVCYKKSIDHAAITISGVVTHGNNAWSFNADVTESSFTDSLLLIMEALAELPFDEPGQPDAAGSD